MKDVKYGCKSNPCVGSQFKENYNFDKTWLMEKLQSEAILVQVFVEILVEFFIAKCYVSVRVLLDY